MVKTLKSSLCQWCKGKEIKLVPVSSLVNLKPDEAVRYEKIWRQQGWPTKLYLCWVCRLNCELAYGGINVWFCPGCRNVFVYLTERETETPAYQQLPVNCQCGWKKKNLTKSEQKRMADQAIKSGLNYRRKQKSYFAKCSFCGGIIEAQKRKKAAKNRNQVRFWSGKDSEERLACNKCVRGNGEFLKLVAEKNRGRWRVYKSKGGSVGG